MNIDQKSIDPEIQHFIEVETQKRRFKTLVYGLTDTCWDKCMGKIHSRLDGSTEGCLTHCVDRFIDTSNFIVNRLEKTQAEASSFAFE